MSLSGFAVVFVWMMAVLRGLGFCAAARPVLVRLRPGSQRLPLETVAVETALMYS